MQTRASWDGRRRIGVPIRTCVGCRGAHEQPQLQRFVREDGSWIADERGRRREGRGVYLCSRACAERVSKNKRFPGLASAALGTVFVE
ncbi:MAG: DUF448 domain-containing protein [Candidatus Eremiobacteraeota bacterium]|nr:DUF448 domain-containing protein [Candidatus Eremiobacteraeota bacterium]